MHQHTHSMNERHTKQKAEEIFHIGEMKGSVNIFGKNISTPVWVFSAMALVMASTAVILLFYIALTHRFANTLPLSGATPTTDTLQRAKTSASDPIEKIQEKPRVLLPKTTSYTTTPPLHTLAQKYLTISLHDLGPGAPEVWLNGSKKTKFKLMEPEKTIRIASAGKEQVLELRYPEAVYKHRFMPEELANIQDTLWINSEEMAVHLKE